MKIWFPVIKTNSGTDIFTIRLADSLRKRGIETIVTWFPWYFEFIPFILRFIPAPKVDVIHTNSWNGFAFRRRKIPLIVTTHLAVLDPAYRKYKSFLQNSYHKTLVRFYEQLSFRSSSLITAVSQYTAAKTRTIFQLPAIEVIYNYLDMDKFCPDTTSTSHDKKFHLLYVGNLSRRKGTELLVPIMEELGKDYELTIVSSDKTKCAWSGANNINISGPVYGDELVKAYQHCDAVLFPTRLEGFGFVALEGMACGKPVITSDNSSLPEIIEHKVSGILCKTDDIEEFVSACKLLRNNADIYSDIAAAARKCALSLFSEKTIISAYVDLYKRSMGH